MQTIFRDKRISSILGIVPDRESLFDDEVGNYSFPVKQSMRLKKIMGFNKHRLSKASSTTSDFAVHGLLHMLDNGWLKRDEIGAVIVVTLSPDYFLPQVCNIVQGKCGLNQDTLCLDIAQGCCGFLVGLMQAFMLLDHMEGKKVLVINGDVLSHKGSRRDRNEFPLAGDATTITVVENAPSAEDIYCEMLMDGSRRNMLRIPAGGFRMPSTPETAEMKDQGDGNFKCLDNMFMDGNGVFTFVQTEVPEMLAHAFRETGKTADDFDYFLFHQPNKFMLRKLAERAGLPEEKVPMDLVENYGNPSGASIPLTAVVDLKDELLTSKKHYCLAAFGSGLAWGTIFMDIGILEHCELLEADL